MTTTFIFFIRYICLCFFSSLSALAYLSLPYFETSRTNLVASLGISSTGLILAFGTIVAAIFGITLLRLFQVVSEPFSSLLRQAESNRLNNAFSPKAKLMEVSRFRYLLENGALINAEMEEHIEEIEANIKEIKKDNKDAHRENDSYRLVAAQKAKQLEELHVERIKLQEACARLESALESERVSNVGEEVEKRSDEIYSQMERAVEASAFKTLWLPKTLQDIRMPATLINNTSAKLSDSWENTSFTHLKEGIDEIRRQSSLQIELLDELSEIDESSTHEESAERHHIEMVS